MRATGDARPCSARGAWRVAGLLVAGALAAACATTPLPAGQDTPIAATAGASPPPAAERRYDRVVEDRILTLDPARVTPADVKLLAQGPTPRIMLLHGGIYPVHLAMESFGQFLVQMGYPEDRIRQPRDGTWSHSPYEDATRLAGIVAWYTEKDGMPPLMIGHSQGGMQAVKVLHVLAGDYGVEVPVWNPLTDFAEDRTTIVDPRTGKPQPVVGLRIGYASAVGAGGAAFILPNQWSLIGKLRTIPDTVEEFTGYWIDVDLWAWTLPGTEKVRDFTASDKVRIRNVTLGAENNHVFLPASADTPAKPAERAWIDGYYPGTKAPVPAMAPPNLLWVADVWYDVKKFWVMEAQRYIRAKRSAGKASEAGHARIAALP